MAYQKRSSMVSRYKELMAEYFVKEFGKQRFTEYQRPYLIEVESVVIRALFESLDMWIKDFDKKMGLHNFLFSLNLEPIAGYGVGAVTTLYFEKFRFAMESGTILLSSDHLFSEFKKNLNKYLDRELVGIFFPTLVDTYKQVFSSRGDIQFYMEDMLKRYALNDLNILQKMEKAVQEFSKHPDIVDILTGDTHSQIQDFRKQSKPITVTEWDCKATWKGSLLDIQFYGKADLKLGTVRMARYRKQANARKKLIDRFLEIFEAQTKDFFYEYLEGNIQLPRGGFDFKDFLKLAEDTFNRYLDRLDGVLIRSSAGDPKMFFQKPGYIIPYTNGWGYLPNIPDKKYPIKWKANRTWRLKNYRERDWGAEYTDQITRLALGDSFDRIMSLQLKNQIEPCFGISYDADLRWAFSDYVTEIVRRRFAARYPRILPEAIYAKMEKQDFKQISDILSTIQFNLDTMKIYAYSVPNTSDQFDIGVFLEFSLELK